LTKLITTILFWKKLQTVQLFAHNFFKYSKLWLCVVEEKDITSSYFEIYSSAFRINKIF